MSFLFVYPARVAPSGGLHQNKSVGRFVFARFSNIRGDISRSLRFVKAPLGCHVGLEHLVLDSTLKQTWSTFHLNNRRSKRVKIGYFESPRILVSFGKSTPPTTEIFQDTKWATIIKLEQNTLPQRIISFSLFSTLYHFVHELYYSEYRWHRYRSSTLGVALPWREAIKYKKIWFYFHVNIYQGQEKNNGKFPKFFSSLYPISFYYWTCC